MKKACLLFALISLLPLRAVSAPEEEITLEPFVLHPRASVYKLLVAPKELQGEVVRVSGFFVFVRQTARLFPSRSDAIDFLPDNYVVIEFSEALAKEERIKELLVFSEPIQVEVVGRFEVRDAQTFPLVLADVSDFLVAPKRKEPNQPPQTTPVSAPR